MIKNNPDISSALQLIQRMPRPELGDNCIQNFHLGMYIVGYTVGNLVLRRRVNIEYGYPHSNALLQIYLNFERYRPHKAACHLTKCDVINDVKLFPTVYHRIYSRKLLTLTNQTSRYKSMCIRIHCFC